MNQFEMKQRAYQSPLKSRALQVLLYLIDRSDKEHTCFPAVPTIARQLHISVSTVKRAMRELVEEGYVKKESRFREGNRGQTSNLYFLFFPENTYEQGNEETVMKQQEEKQIVRGDNDDVEEALLNMKEKERSLVNLKQQKLPIIKWQPGEFISLVNEWIIDIWINNNKKLDRSIESCISFYFSYWPGEGVNLRPP